MRDFPFDFVQGQLQDIYKFDYGISMAYSAGCWVVDETFPSFLPDDHHRKLKVDLTTGPVLRFIITFMCFVMLSRPA